jgi:hypothetical protein
VGGEALTPFLAPMCEGGTFFPCYHTYGFLYLSKYLSIFLSEYPCISFSLYVCLCVISLSPPLSIYVPLSLFISSLSPLYIHLSAFLSSYLSICSYLSLHSFISPLCFCLYVYLSLNLSLFLSYEDFHIKIVVCCSGVSCDLRKLNFAEYTSRM